MNRSAPTSEQHERGAAHDRSLQHPGHCRTCTQRRQAAPRAGRPPARQPHRAAAAVGRADHRGPPALLHDEPGGLLRGDLGVRQLRRGARDGQRRGAPGLRTRPLRADHPARRRDARGGRDRPAAEGRAGPLALREVPRGLRAPQPCARRLRAGSQPHRQHGRRQLRRAARTGHPRAAGRAAGAVDPGAAGARAAADPADHRRARRRPAPSSSPSSCCTGSGRTGRSWWSSTSRGCRTWTRPWPTPSSTP